LLRIKGILCHQALQEIDVALKTTRSLVEPAGLRAVFYPGNILRMRGTEHNYGDATTENCDLDHFLSTWIAARARAQAEQ
jgi:hypothetical protein